MAISAKLLFSGIAAACCLVAAPAAAQMEPASGEDMAEAVQECMTVTSAEEVDVDKMRADDWENYRIRSGRSSEVQPDTFQKKGNPTLIIVGRQERHDRKCIVMGRLGATSDYNPAAETVSMAIGLPTRRDGFTYIWEFEDQTVQLQPSGDRDAPNALFTITANKD